MQFDLIWNIHGHTADKKFPYVIIAVYVFYQCEYG